ncbi:sphingomyelin phosphodiesterase [Aspergillus melleus]|uniref:sphingomyelin phosphodiesterase n=1 Tax=Aspergillus melleus TaxID=138277 RepID=UPI001E8E67F4|nr:uncharacterized protein LDX57_006488 [Aspergillus melleus]KAH8428809.1 hypothetical protein LDX57_006488 [Aspergillus melleus]
MRPAFLLAALASIGVQAKTESDWAKTIWDDVKEAVTCASCEGLLGTLKLVAGLGQEALIRVVTDVCIISGVEDADVCKGLIAAQGPAVYYVLKELHVGSQTSKTFCAHVVGLCDYPPVQPDHLELPPAPSTATRPPPSGQSPIRVAHISDTHVDHAYQPGSNAFCSKPLCCRSWTDDDAPGHNAAPCGPLGDPHGDSPAQLEASMMAAVAALDPAFTLYTGDVPAHDIWMVNQSSVLRDLNSTYDRLGGLGLVYAALGNHDAAPLNLFPATDNGIPASHRPQWAYDALSDDWTALMGPNFTTPKKTPQGSYSILHGAENNNKDAAPLRIISYNSVLYYKYNFYAYTDPMPADPDGLLAWLIDELTAAESAGQRVWLVAHIPHGGPDTLHDYSAAFDRVVNRFADTIAALFYGHTHTDLFQVSYRDYAPGKRTAQSASAIGYIAPSLTPTSGPPAFRIYEIDPVTFAVLDYTVYIADLPTYESTSTSPHDESSQAPELHWKKYYSAKETYGAALSPPITSATTELTPSFWHNVTEAMERDEAVFQGFWERTTRGYNVSECTGACARTEICALRGGDGRYNCRVGGLGMDELAKRETEERDGKMKRPGCEDDGLGRVLGEMLRRPGVERLIRERAGLE